MPGDSLVFLQTASIALVEHLPTRLLPGGEKRIIGPDLRFHALRVLFLALFGALLPCRGVVEGLFWHGGRAAEHQNKCDQCGRLFHACSRDRRCIRVREIHLITPASEWAAFSAGYGWTLPHDPSAIMWVTTTKPRGASRAPPLSSCAMVLPT